MISDTGTADALLIFPPMHSERTAGLIDEDLIGDSGHPFEYPQGVLSIASYLASSTGGKMAFRARVLHLDSHLYQMSSSGDTALSDPDDVERSACQVAENYARSTGARLVGISVSYYLAEPMALAIAKHLRDALGNEVVIGVGGQEVSYYDYPHRRPSRNQLLEEHDYLDFVARRSGEYTMQRMLECLADGDDLKDVLGISYRDAEGVHVNHDRGTNDLLNLSSIDNDLLILPPDTSLADFLGLTNVSLVLIRGCAHGMCTFCSSRNWFGPMDSMRDLGPLEFDEFFEKCERTLRGLFDHGVREVQLLDEAINSSIKYFGRLCDLLKRLRMDYDFRVLAETRADFVEAGELALMREAGVSRLYLGVESASIKVLRAMNKQIEQPLLRDKALVQTVRERCPELMEMEPELQQIVCACHLVKSAGISLGLFFMVGHPGSSVAEESRSKWFLETLFQSGILGEGDSVEIGIFMPLQGTVARSLPGVRLLVEDKRKWGRMSGHAVCEVSDLETGAVFAQADIEKAFRDMVSVVDTYQDVDGAHRSRW